MRVWSLFKLFYILIRDIFAHFSQRVKACLNPLGSQKTPNPYLLGNFAPVYDELVAESLPVEGFLPPSIDGEFIRNGPNPQFQPEGDYHWFDGDGMLHGIRIEEGRATYVNKFVQTARFQEEKKAGKPLFMTIGMLNSISAVLAFASKMFVWNLLSRFFSVQVPKGGGTANTALTYHDGRLLALVEADAPHHVELPNLNTVGRFTFNGQLDHAMSAHPKIDPETGELIVFSYQFHKKPTVWYRVFSAQGESICKMPIDLPVPVMMHDCAVTEHYSIALDLPLTWSLGRLAEGSPPIMFESQRRARFGILPRHAKDQSEIRWFSTESCYMFHTANAWEEGDEIVLLGCRSQEVLSTLFKHEGTQQTGNQRSRNADPFMHEWRFNLKTGGVVERPLDVEDSGEFPEINKHFLGRKNRYVYMGKTEDHTKSNGMPLFDGVIKYDLETGTKKVFSYGEGKYGGECVFVHKDDNTIVQRRTDDEDEGYLMTFVFDHKTNSSEFWLIDAKKMSYPPLAKVKLPRRVPYGFHGTWVSGRQIEQQKGIVVEGQ